MTTTDWSKMPRDYRDLLALLVSEACDFVIVGGWALSVHGHVRATKDLDATITR